MQRQWLEGVAAVGVTADASVPEILVKGVVARLYEWGGTLVSEDPGGREEMIFSLPRELAAIAAAA